MFTFLAIVYTVICLFLILVVLLQAGKGGGMGAAFGGGATQQVFGGAGAGNFLTRLTWISAVLFMVLSGTLAYMSSSSDKSLERAGQVQHERVNAVSGHTKAPTKVAPAGMSGSDAGGGAAAPEAPTPNEDVAPPAPEGPADDEIPAPPPAAPAPAAPPAAPAPAAHPAPVHAAPAHAPAAPPPDQQP